MPGIRMTMHLERWRTLDELDEWLRVPMLLLSLAWLVLIVVDLTFGTSPQARVTLSWEEHGQQFNESQTIRWM